MSEGQIFAEVERETEEKRIEEVDDGNGGLAEHFGHLFDLIAQKTEEVKHVLSDVKSKTEEFTVKSGNRGSAQQSH